MSIRKKFTKTHIEHFKNNKNLITSDLLDALRSQGNEGKSIALDILDTEKDEEHFHLDAFGNRMSYNGIKNIKKSDIQMFQHKIHEAELRRCMEDPFYFIGNYIRITTKSGLDFPDFRQYQIDFIQAMFDNEAIISKLPRQASKTTSTALYLIHCIIFGKDINTLIVANTGKMAREFLDKIKKMYITLPLWMQQGIVVWNKTYIEFENNCRIMTDACTGAAGRGFTFNKIIGDEIAHINVNMWDEFADSVFPASSAMSHSKSLILLSTPKGLNHFYTLYQGALEGVNGFLPYEMDWRDVPRFDKNGVQYNPEKFKDEMTAKHGQQYWMQNFECISGKSIINIEGYGDIPIEKLHKQYGDSDIVLNSNNRVLTSSGYSSFHGIRRSKNHTLIFELEDRSIEVTPNHTFIIEGKDIIAWALKSGDYLDTTEGLKRIEEVFLGKSQYVYDILETEDHSYIANGIINHNCSFIGSSHTMINVDTLKEIRPKQPELIKEGKLKIYHEPIKGHQYVMGVDPSMGISGDFFGIQIVDITNLDMKQVASARLDMEYLKIPDYIHEWCLYYNNAYLIIENNLGSGQSITDMMVNNYEYENIHYDKSTENNKRKKYSGFRTTVKTRKQILDNMKLFIENGKLEINDEDTYKEFFTFIYTKNKYQADDGCKDDMIMALALCFAPFCNTRNFEDMREISKIIFGEASEEDNNAVSLLSFGYFDDGIAEQKTDEWGYSIGSTYEDYDSPFA